MNKIFIVTMLTDIDFCLVMSGNDGHAQRTVGWFATLEEAENNLKVNCGDVYENNFDFAVIEEVSPGFYSGASAKQTWYEWVPEHKGYKSINQPPQWFGITAIGIG
jgi:hypothetical protein